MRRIPLEIPELAATVFWACPLLQTGSDKLGNPLLPSGIADQSREASDLFLYGIMETSWQTRTPTGSQL